MLSSNTTPYRSFVQNRRLIEIVKFDIFTPLMASEAALKDIVYVQCLLADTVVSVDQWLCISQNKVDGTARAPLCDFSAHSK